MVKWVLAATLVGLAAASQTAPALAKHVHTHHAGTDMAVHMASERTPEAGVPVQALSPTARNAERAIIWQDSLHGEGNGRRGTRRVARPAA